MATKPRPVWFYIPLAGRRTDEAARHVGSLVTAVMPWITRLVESGHPAVKKFTYDDDIRCALAGALVRTEQWDGYKVARELETGYFWPCDAELVQAIHRWSCDLKTTSINAWRERKAKSEAGA